MVNHDEELELSPGSRGAQPPQRPDADAVIGETYQKLRRIAHQHLRRYRPGQTLNTTAVVHEAYLKLADEDGSFWDEREEFFRVMSTVMRHLIVDYARRLQARKRGGGAVMVTLDEAVHAGQVPIVDVVALDDALRQLGEHDPKLERIVECRFFAGMTVEETAGALNSPLRTVERDWARARAYLLDALER